MVSKYSNDLLALIHKHKQYLQFLKHEIFSFMGYLNYNSFVIRQAIHIEQRQKPVKINF